MRITITGGSGTLGRALIRRCIETGAERIVTFTRCQHKREALVRDFGSYPGITDRVFWHDLSSVDRLVRTFHGSDLVVHAAAAKVVGAHTDEPEGLVETNVHGTERVIAAAKLAGVRKVLVISSDKAVEATNTYGVSKAQAEALAVASNAKSWPQTRIACLRYGNVLGSTGSVVVKWRAALAAGVPLAISDPRMTRFWVRIDQAVDYVFQALDMMRGGEIVVPELLAAPITRIAEAIGGAPPYQVTGIRPGGEKLHESLLSEDEVRRTVAWRGMYLVLPAHRTWDSMPWPGTPIPANTRYRSDVWTQASLEQIRAWLA